MSYMLMPLRRYADFNGRSRRKEFWLWTLFQVIIACVLGGILAWLFIAAAQRVADRGGVTKVERGGSYSAPATPSYDTQLPPPAPVLDNGLDPTGDDATADPEAEGAADPEALNFGAYSGFSSSYSVKYNIDPFMLLQEFGTGGWIVFGLAMVWSFIIFIPNIAVTIRRLHDINKTGWLYLLYLIPLIGPIVLFVFFVQEGTRGPNQYGPDPKSYD